MLPLNKNLMEAWTISKLITNRKESPDRAEVQARFDYSELKPPSLTLDF